MDLIKKSQHRRFDDLLPESWAWTHKKDKLDLQVAPKPIIFPSPADSLEIIAGPKMLKKVKRTTIKTIKKRGANGEITSEEIHEPITHEFYETRGNTESNLIDIPQRCIPEEKITEPMVKPVSEATFIWKSMKCEVNFLKQIITIQKLIRNFLALKKARPSYKTKLSVTSADNLFIENRSRENQKLLIREENIFSVIDPVRQKRPLSVDSLNSFSIDLIKREENIFFLKEIFFLYKYY